MLHQNQHIALNLYAANTGNYREKSPAASDDSSLETREEVVSRAQSNAPELEQEAKIHFLEKEPVMPKYSEGSTKTIKIKPMDKDLFFNGTNMSVDKFIRRYEVAGKTDGAVVKDLAKQIIPFIRGNNLKDEVEEMSGYEDQPTLTNILKEENTVIIIK